MNIKKIGIVGFGEIGKGLYDVYNEFETYEIVSYDISFKTENKDKLVGCDILNICIPYCDNFVEIVNAYIKTYVPFLTIIHSTVRPGTTKLLYGNVCHSPVRGIHPHLKDGIKTFLKYIGSEDRQIGEFYQKHLNDLGINSYICENSITSEFAKLIDTTYYGVCIAFHNEINELCEKYNLSFDEVMTKYNSSYNEGYSFLGKQNVIRPVLIPGNKIGGHCVVPNVNILKEFTNSDFINLILKYE